SPGPPAWSPARASDGEPCGALPASSDVERTAAAAGVPWDPRRCRPSARAAGGGPTALPIDESRHRRSPWLAAYYVTAYILEGSNTFLAITLESLAQRCQADPSGTSPHGF